MINELPPFAIFFIGALIIPFLRGCLKQAFLLLIPIAAFWSLLNLSEGVYWVVNFLNYQLIFGKVDRMSLAFGYIFTIISFIALLYSLRINDDNQYISGLLYGGSAVGAVFAGDFITLYIFWEVMAVTATFIIWASKTKASQNAGMRYLVIHIFGGLCLLIGILMHVHQTGSIEFGYIGLNSMASYFILLGFGINAAFPILHAWLPDAYPEATFSGTVFLSAFTTKTAVYVLARSFPGTEMLIWVGATMTAFPIFYAVIENNLRRVLSYSLINQVGFMVVGVGIGTQLSINGTVAHAFCHILYKALLFMSMGAVLHQTGKINATDLGGLYKTMPLTMIFCCIGAASISAFPLFSGFVSKSMIVSAAAHDGLTIIWFMLIFASAGVFHHSGIKIPYFAFFSHDSGIRTKEPPLNMLIAMGIAAFLCVFLGTFPSYLYNILPYPVDYVPYSGYHIIDQLQLLFFSALAFTLLMRSGNYPAEIRCTNVDFDWFYRKGASAFMWVLRYPLSIAGAMLNAVVFSAIPKLVTWIIKNPKAAARITFDSVLVMITTGETQARLQERIKKELEVYPGDIIRQQPIGFAVLGATLILFAYMLIYYVT